jgi:hypothetical protein
MSVTPSGVPAWADVSARTNRKTVPVDDDGRPRGRQHRWHGNGELTGRGRSYQRGTITGAGTFLDGILHTLPFLISQYRSAPPSAPPGDRHASDASRDRLAEAGGEGFVAAQDAGRAPARAWQEVQVREALGQGSEADFALHPGQRGAEAVVAVSVTRAFPRPGPPGSRP